MFPRFGSPKASPASTPSNETFCLTSYAAPIESTSSKNSTMNLITNLRSSTSYSSSLPVLFPAALGIGRHCFVLPISDFAANKQKSQRNEKPWQRLCMDCLLTLDSPTFLEIELFRLERRYTTRRSRRTTFISEAQYVDGEYVYGPRKGQLAEVGPGRGMAGRGPGAAMRRAAL